MSLFLLISMGKGNLERVLPWYVLFKAFDLPLWFHFLLLIAVSSTFSERQTKSEKKDRERRQRSREKRRRQRRDMTRED